MRQEPSPDPADAVASGDEPVAGELLDGRADERPDEAGGPLLDDDAGGEPDDGDGAEPSPADRAVHTALGGRSVAVAESFTGGLLAARIVAIPGSGQWLRGAIVAYASDVKFDVLGVREGPVVCATAAEQMAAGVCALFGADVGIATTGVAGPAMAEDQPVGTAWIGWCVDGHTTSREFHFEGDPDHVRATAVEAVLALSPDVLAVEELDDRPPR